MAAAEHHLVEEAQLKRFDGTIATCLIVAATEEHFDVHETRWRPILKATGALDADWEWRADFLRDELPSPTRETYSLLADGSLQALMSIEVQADGVYVERIAVSPANRTPQKLRGCGARLLLVAVQRSADLKLKGRLWLHSLEDKDTLRFYREKMKMLETAIEKVDGQKMRRFELTEERAAVLLGGKS